MVSLCVPDCLYWANTYESSTEALNFRWCWKEAEASIVGVGGTESLRAEGAQGPAQAGPFVLSGPAPASAPRCAYPHNGAKMQA